MPVSNGVYAFAFKSENPSYPPLVLIHGAGGTHLNWPAEIRRLSGYEVLALDLPGHGKSEGHGEQTIEGYAAAVLGWMDSIQLYRAFMVGHSMGGMVVLQLALESPRRVSGLGLFSSGARLPVDASLIENTTNRTTFPAALEKIQSLSYGPAAGERLVQLGMKRLAENRPSVLHNDFMACQAFDALERLAEIHHPTLVVCGAEDRLAPVRHSQYLASKIEGAELRVIPEAGHMVILEKPGKSVEILRSYLEENRWKL
jgi:pimeloyl-ACP methyl ester carboxylesterase